MSRPHARPMYTIDDIKDMLHAQIGQVAYHYAPAVQGSYEDKGRYFTLSPGRADRSVGSFYIHLDGEKVGRWQDHATGQFGDVLDLIALALNCSGSDALREARAFLGLASADPNLVRQREQAAARARAHRQDAAARARDKKARAAKNAHRIYLSAHAKIADTPVEFYLRDKRGIDLRALGHQPGCLRYLPECYYKNIDRETGEVIEGKFPAMIASVNNSQGQTVAVHRTYLGLGRDGIWGKADLPTTKKVLGDYAGAWINIWKGRSAEGRFGKPITRAAPGARVYVSEGIEDALSAAILLPEERHIAAISLSNLGQINLPPAVTEIVLVADKDENEEARAALQRAVKKHQSAGRNVRIWQNNLGGKDLNDALATITKGQGAA